MNVGRYIPSTRAKIRNNVVAIADKAKRTESAVWRQLYESFEHQSNTPWRKLAHNASKAALTVVEEAGKLEEMLECAHSLAVHAGVSQAGDDEFKRCSICGNFLGLH